MSKQQRGREFSGVFTYHNPIPFVNDDGVSTNDPDESGVSTSFLIADDVVSTHQSVGHDVGASHRAIQYRAADEEAPNSRSNSIHVASPPMVHVHRHHEDGKGDARQGGDTLGGENTPVMNNKVKRAYCRV